MRTRPRRSTGGLLSARRRRTGRGLSVIEFVVAAALILAILVASGITLANVERSLASTRARDGATLLAANLLNQAQQFRCQLTVDPADAAGESARCAVRLAGASASTTAGDLMFKSTFPAGCQVGAAPGCIAYTALITSRWLDPTTDPAQCQSPPRQPSLLRRSLELRWRPTGAVADVVYRTSTYQSVPQSSAYDASSRNILVVRTTPGKVVTFSTSQGTITRVAEACDDNQTGEAWFPYRPGQQSDHSVAVSAAAIGNDDWSGGTLPSTAQAQSLDMTGACLLWRPTSGGKPGACQ